MTWKSDTKGMKPAWQDVGVVPEGIPKEKWAKGGHVKGTDDDFYEKPFYPHNHEITVELQNDFEAHVWDILMGIMDMLFEKNRKYGDAALNPARIFSKADTTEQIKVRIDDKLNRIKNAQDDEDEDVVKDLIGYLILLTIARDNA